MEIICLLVPKIQVSGKLQIRVHQNILRRAFRGHRSQLLFQKSLSAKSQRGKNMNSSFRGLMILKIAPAPDDLSDLVINSNAYKAFWRSKSTVEEFQISRRKRPPTGLISRNSIKISQISSKISQISSKISQISSKISQISG